MLINVVTFDEEAIYLAKTLNKGDRIFVIGTPRIRAYADSEGCIHERITLISEQVVLMEHQYFECDEDADSRNAKE